MHAPARSLRQAREFGIRKPHPRPLQRRQKIQHPHRARLREIIVLEFMQIVGVALGFMLDLRVCPLDEQDHLGAAPLSYRPLEQFTL